MRVPVFLFCFFLSIGLLSARETATVLSDAAGITVVFDKLSAQIENGEAGVSAHIDNSNYTAPRASRDVALDMIQMLVALPEGEVPQPVLTIGKETYLATGKLSRDERAPATFAPVSLEPGVQLRLLGKQRGVTVAALYFNPYRYDAQTQRLSYVSGGMVSLRYAKPVSMVSGTANRNAMPMAADLINKNILPALIDQMRANAPHAITSIDETNEWYSPSGTYVKLTTTRDGIARVTATDLTAAEPGFAGADISHLRLLLDGREYPLSIQNDNDGILNAGDELYFMGRRAYGDTTWFDTYTDQCAFFLTISSEGLPARRLRPFNPVTETFSVINTVRIDRHEENDRVYYLGDDTDFDHTTTLHRSQTVPGEGWYWGMFNYDPSNKSNFEYLHVLTPSDNPADVLSIGYHTYSVSDNRAFELDHRTSYELNGLALGEDIAYNGFRKSTFRKDIPSSEVLAGANMLRLRALGVEGNRQEPNYTEITAADYFTFQGTVRPFAWKGVLDCSTGAVNQNSLLSMPGFSSSMVYVIDTVQQSFIRLQGRAGTTVRIGARAGATPAATIVVNDSIAVYTGTAGLSIVVVPSSNSSAMTVRHYANPAAEVQQIRDIVQTATDGSSIVVALAGADLPQELKTVFQSLGSTRVQQISGEAAWVFAVKKGGTASIDNIASGSVSGATFISHAGGNSYEATLPLQGLEQSGSYQLISCDDAHVEQAGIVAIHPVDLKENTRQADVLIVTHRDFREQADSLARYRRVKNKMNVEVVDAEDIYKQFSYGRKSPHAIKAFLSYAYHNWQQPKPLYLVLFGDASWDARNVSDGAITHDFVPTYGRPVSDFWYTLLDGDDFLADLIVGRISVETPAQAQSVVNKIVEYESLPKQPWMKRFLMMSGGKDKPEVKERTFLRRRTIEDYETHLMTTPLCAEIDTVFKQDDNESSVSQATTIRSKINSGAVWVSYVGHASPVTFDMDFGKAADLNNGNQYSVLATYSCQTAAFAEPYITGKNEDFVREAGKGFIGAFGTTGFGEINIDRETAVYMYRAMRFDSLRALGDILFSAKAIMAGFADRSYYENTLYQHSLLGDPLLTLALEKESDLYLLQQDIHALGKSGSAVIAENDSTVTLSTVLRNAGVHAKFFEYDADSIPVFIPIHILVVREYEGKKDSVRLLFDEVCADIPFSAVFNIEGMPGQHFITIHANPDSTEPEATFSNNIIYDTLTVYPSRAFALDPLPYWNVDTRSPVFRVVNPVNIGELQMEFSLSQNGDPGSAFALSTLAEVEYEEAFTQWRPSAVTLVAGTSYWVHIRTHDALGEYGEWMNIPITASENAPQAETQWTLRRAEHFTAGTVEHLSVDALNDSTELRLGDYEIPVHVISNGNQETRNLLIEIDGSQIVDWTTFHGGFNISILPPGSAKPRAYRWYSTFSIPNPKSMGNSSDMIRFLRDSVALGEVAVIAVYDEAFAGPIEVQKNLDTLVETLKSFGAVLADSLLAHGEGSARNSSYILIGRKGGPLVAEAWRLADNSQKGDGVEIDTTLVVHDLTGSIVTPNVGPATQWHSVSLDTRNSAGGAFTTIVTGRKPGGQETELLSTSATVLDLSSISATDYPYLKFSVVLNRSNEEQHPILTGLHCRFVPTAELAVREAETGPAADSVLRGDFVHFRATVQNISRRVAAQPFTLSTEIRAAGSATAPPVLFSVPVSTLAPDALYNFETPVPTTELAAVSDITVTAYPGEEELYSFNNKRSYSLHVREDNVKPSIVIEMDGRIVQDGDYVSQQPATVIRLMDNSSLTINSPEKLLVSLNGKYRTDPQPNMENYQFSSQQVGNQRARASFTSLLEPGINSMRVVAEDATGNRDTTYITVSVATTPVIKKLLSSPNPFREQTAVTFILGDKQQPTGGEAVVYNTTGRLVKRADITPHIGLNTFTWDASDNDGRSVAEGVYLIRIFIRGVDGVFESATQKTVLIR